MAEMGIMLGVIQIKPKTKISAQPKKKTARKVSVKTPRVEDDSGFTPEDIAEINMFSAATAKMNWKHASKNWDKTVAAWKKFQKAKTGA